MFLQQLSQLSYSHPLCLQVSLLLLELWLLKPRRLALALMYKPMPMEGRSSLMSQHSPLIVMHRGPDQNLTGNFRSL